MKDEQTGEEIMLILRYSRPKSVDKEVGDLSPKNERPRVKLTGPQCSLRSLFPMVAMSVL